MILYHGDSQGFRQLIREAEEMESMETRVFREWLRRCARPSMPKAACSKSYEAGWRFLSDGFSSVRRGDRGLRPSGQEKP
jgi:hypothetical protein